MASFFASLAIASQDVTFGLSLRALGFGQTLLGSHLSAAAAGTLIFALPAAFLIGRLSLALLLSRALLCLSLTWLIRAWIPIESIRLGFSFFSGCFLAFYSVGASLLLLEITPSEDQPRAFSQLASAGLLGAFIGSFLAGSTPEWIRRWMTIDQAFRSTLTLSAMTLAIGSACLWRTSILIPHAQKIPLQKFSWRELDHGGLTRRLRRVFQIVAPHWVLAFGAAASVGFLPIFLADRFQLTSLQVGMVFSVSQATTWIGVQFCPWLMRKHGNAGTVVRLQGWSLPFLLAIAFVPLGWMVSVAIVARATLMNMTGPALGLFHFERVIPEDRKLVSSLDVVLWNTAWVVVPQFSGLLITRAGYVPSLLFTTLCYGISTWMVARAAARR